MQRPANVPRRASDPEFQRTQRMSEPVTEKEEALDIGDERYYTVRTPNSTRRYYDTRGNQVIQRGNQRIIIHEEPPPQYRKRRFHWLFFVGLAMFTMLIGWVLLTTVANWWQVTQDDWHYGRPRTYQVDAVVGHNDSAANQSHFIALNLRGQIEVIEFPGGDATKAKIYMGPDLIGPGQDLAPVTLTFQDVNGDGKIDMIVNVQGSHFIFLNGGSQFKPAK